MAATSSSASSSRPIRYPASAPGSPSWGGINNTFFPDRSHSRHRGRDHDAVLPFADAKALAVHDAFERGAYQLVNAER